MERRWLVRSGGIAIAALVLGAAMQVLAAFAFGRGNGWWTVAALLGSLAAILGGLVASWTARHWWPLLPILLANTLILVVGGNVLAAHELRGLPSHRSVIASRVCDHARSSCVYHYTLRDPDGTPVPGTLSPPGGDPLEVGDRVDVVLDPGGWFGPRLVRDLADGTDAKILDWTVAADLVLVVGAWTAGLSRAAVVWPRPRRARRRGQRDVDRQRHVGEQRDVS